MKVFCMKAIDHSLRIGITELVKGGLAHRVPPEPVLHDVVHRNVHYTILLRDIEQLLLRLVAIFALPKAIRPLAEHWRSARELTIFADDPIELRAIEKVIVNRVSDLRTEI